MQDFFERKVFRSGNGGSEYDPQTYTLRFAGPYPGVPFVNRLFHELIHWIQHICYTFGGFQSASIHMRDELAKQVLIKYAKSKVDYQRHQVQFSLPESRAFFNSYFDHEGIEQNIWMHQHAWRDQLICENLFLQMSECYEDGKGYKGISSVHEILQPELLIPRTLLRINNWAIGTLGYRSIEPRGPLEITNVANHPKLINFGRASHAGIELDTRDIIEGMAVAFEMYSIRMEADAKKRLEEILETPVSEYYVRAVKIFLEIMGLSLRHDNVARMAMMFLAIAEMSLDPPLPPFGIINKLELDWNKIYPPLRFIQLCHTVRDVVGTSGYIIDPRIYNWILDREGKVGPEPSHYLIGSHLYSWLFDWIANVEALYLSHGGVFSYLSRDKDGYLSNEKSVPFLALIAEKNPDMRDILRHKGVNTIGMAEKFREVLKWSTGLELYAMLRHGHILFMNWFGTQRPFFSLFEYETWGHALRPPVVIHEDGENSNFNSGWSVEFALDLIDYNLFHYPLHDIILRKNKPGLYLPGCPLVNGYPIISEEKRKEHWTHLQKTFSYIF